MTKAGVLFLLAQADRGQSARTPAKGESEWEREKEKQKQAPRKIRDPFSSSFSFFRDEEKKEMAGVDAPMSSEVPEMNTWGLCPLPVFN